MDLHPLSQRSIAPWCSTNGKAAGEAFPAPALSGHVNFNFPVTDLSGPSQRGRARRDKGSFLGKSLRKQFTGAASAKQGASVTQDEMHRRSILREYNAVIASGKSWRKIGSALGRIVKGWERGR
jgi:hypothetical protein